MPDFVSKAKLLCTGCPGAPSELKTTEAGKIKVKGDIIGVESDKEIQKFPQCIAIPPPAPPKPCNPQLVKWSHVDEKVKFNRKSALKFPNMISCTSGPGIITMTYSGQYISRNGATSDDPEDKNCGWKDCPKEHKDKIEYELKDVGCVERTTSFPGGWPHPNGCGYEENKNGVGQGPNAYAIQRHHVLPCDAFTSCSKLKVNLVLMGFDINNGLPNGICLPENEDDMFWHDLQFHRGSHPGYNGKVEKELKQLDNESADLCKDDSQQLLIAGIEDLADEFRNRILNWTVLIDGNSPLLRQKSFADAGVISGIPVAQNRKYLGRPD